MQSRNQREGHYAGKAKTFLLMPDYALKLIKTKHSRTWHPVVALKRQA